MSRRAALLMLFVLTTGCNFDEEWQLNLRYPASLVLKNNALQTVHVKGLVSSAEAQNTFVFQDVSMVPGATRRWRIREGEYNDISAGAFILYGTCGSRPDWEATGQTLDREAIRNAKRWDVTVSISRCDP